MIGGLTRFILVVLLAANIAGCNQYKSDIDTVKAADSIVPGKSNEVIAIEIAGARGVIDWTAGRSEKYDDPAMVVVSAVIKRIGATGVKHKVELQFLNNRQTKKVAFDQVLVDDKPKDLISGAMSLFMMQLE
jgi:ribosomal protein S28E/S33